MVFKPVHSTAPPAKKRHNHTLKAKCSTIINVDIWKKKKFIIWTIALPVSLFGYFVIFVHLVKYVSLNFEEYDGKILIQCIAITSLIGRLVSGKIADLPNANRIFLQQVCIHKMASAVKNFGLCKPPLPSMGFSKGCAAPWIHKLALHTPPISPLNFFY